MSYILLLIFFSLQIAGSLEIAESSSDGAVYSLVALSQCHIIFVFILLFCYINLIIFKRFYIFGNRSVLVPRCGHKKMPRSGHKKVPQGHKMVPWSGHKKLPRSGHKRVPRSGHENVPRSGHKNVPTTGH